MLAPQGGTPEWNTARRGSDATATKAWGSSLYRRAGRVSIMIDATQFRQYSRVERIIAM
jgi:hypothetical protein